MNNPELEEAKRQALETMARRIKERRIAYYIPHEGQEDFVRAKNKTRLFISGNRVGKTEIGIIEDISFCLGYRPYLPNWDPDYKTPFTPPIKGLITTQALGKESSLGQVIVPKLKDWIPKEELKETKKNQQGVEVQWIFRNGSELRAMAYEQDVRQFEGFEVHFWHGDEPPPEKIYGGMVRALATFGGWKWITMTPVIDDAFTYNALYLDENNYKTKILGIEANLKHKRKWWHNGNKRYTDSDYGIEVQTGGLQEEAVEEFRRQLYASGLDPAEIEARLTGQFRSLSGRIIDVFDSKIHTCDSFPVYARDYTIYVAIDPHPKKPWCITFMAVDRGGKKYIFKCLYLRSTLENICMAINVELGSKKIKAQEFIIDPQAIVEESEGENLITKIFKISDKKIFCFKAARSEGAKEQGIQLIRDEFNYDFDLGIEPTLFIFSTEHEAIKQINSWMWDDTGKTDKVKASKKDDDFCENLYRLLLRNPKFVEKNKINTFTEAQKRRRKIKGVGS